MCMRTGAHLFRPRLLTRFQDVYYAFYKPAGMAVHPSTEDVPNLVGWLATQRSFPKALKPVHRLDRGTSGVVLCAAGKKGRAQANEWLSQSSKKYLALVAGFPSQKQGIFDSPLFDRRRGKNRAAATTFEVRTYFGGFTLLELEILTGRKHQIRRHLADAKLPVVGDSRYGPKHQKPVPEFPNRLWLHAETLQLPHRTIVAPLASELQEHLGSLLLDDARCKPISSP